MRMLIFSVFQRCVNDRCGCFFTEIVMSGFWLVVGFVCAVLGCVLLGCGLGMVRVYVSWLC